MPELPRGTVTFLFTDIEGSTRLLHELGDSYAEALVEHRRLLRQAFTAHAGVEVDTQGDAFFIAFAEAKNALAAAAKAQQALGGGPIKVRMGIHTGEPIVTGEGYIGIDVHRAARICGAGHGGQVLVSRTTRDLLEGGFTLTDLGEHRLKDLAEPEWLYQLVIPGLKTRFAPLKSLSNTNLPAEAAALIGRERELAELSSVLREGARLVTLTGPGGTGKTRLALRVAAEHVEKFRNGVFFVPLAPLRDPVLVIPTVAETLGVTDVPGERLAETLARHLEEKDLLLLVDNVEHVLEAAPDIAQLIRASPGLRVLATSRERLHLSGEREFPVPSLAEEEAVALFTEQARSVRPGFEPNGEVAKICARLDGLPLAIELAAARVKILPPQEILARLERRLPLLVGGPRDLPARQRTLHATIEWSHDLLDEDERLLFARLAVFTGGWTLQAAEAICEADIEMLASLLDKSLIRGQDQPAGEARFSMLETIREYAHVQLEATGESDSMRERHAEYYLTLAEEAEPHLRGARQIEWLGRLDREQTNLFAAMTWALERDRLEIPLRFAHALWRFWETRATIADMRAMLDEALARAVSAPALLRAGALFGTGRIALRQGRYEDAQVMFEESRRLSRDADDHRGVALSLAGLGWIALIRGEHARAIELCRQSLDLARRLGERWIIADALNNLGCALDEAESSAEAKLAHEESLALRRQIGDLEGVGAALANLGGIAIEEGELDRAETLLEESRSLAEARGDLWFLASMESSLAYVALARGDLTRAADRSERGLAMCRELGFRELVARALQTLAGVAAARGEASRAARLSGGAHSAYEAVGAAPPSPAPAVQRWLEHARSELGESRWEAAFTEGRVRIDAADVDANSAAVPA